MKFFPMLFMPRKYTRVIELEWDAKVMCTPLQGFPRDFVEDGGPSRISKYSLVQSSLGKQISWMSPNLLIRKLGGTWGALLYFVWVRMLRTSSNPVCDADTVWSFHLVFFPWKILSERNGVFSWWEGQKTDFSGPCGGMGAAGTTEYFTVLGQ